MNFLLDLKVLALLFVANGAPVVAKKLLGDRWQAPLDGGVTFFDRQPLLGHSKTIRGILFSVLLTTVTALLLELGWVAGLVIGVGAMSGDLISSFIKRRMKMPASSQAMGLDQLPEAIIPLIACAQLLSLTWGDVAIITAAFFIAEFVFSKLLFRLHIRDRPF